MNLLDILSAGIGISRIELSKKHNKQNSLLAKAPEIKASAFKHQTHQDPKSLLQNLLFYIFFSCIFS